MKKLNKLRLINWHLFTNTTTNIENITFLTGANGTGKSTIIDALQIVLLGDTTGRNFNKAANEKASRTLMGYLRCETGRDSSGTGLYLRKGRFSSYIAIEFYDDVNDSYFTVGIVFDIVDSEKDQSFFYINDKFPENNFTNADSIDSSDAKRPLAMKELQEYCKANYSRDDYKFFDTNASYQNFIKEMFGNLPDKYFTLFKKSVSFAPISNISQFITEFVCDVDYHIDIEPMQKNIAQYKELEIEAKKMETKIAELNQIKTYYEEFEFLNKSLGSFKYMGDRVNLEKATRAIETTAQDIKIKESRVREIDNIIDSKNVSILELRETKDSYLAKKLASGNFSLAESLKGKKNQVANQITTIQREFEDTKLALKNYANDHIDSINNLISKYKSVDTAQIFSKDLDQGFVKFFQHATELKSLCYNVVNCIDKNSIDEDLVFEFQQELDIFRQQALGLLTLARTEMGGRSSEMEQIANDISKMSSGEKPFPYQYLEVKNEFEAEMTSRHHDAKIQVYCDLIDITDREWRKSIEAALSAQKINLFINDKYFNEASKVLGEICAKYNYYRISLIDAEKIIRSSPVCNGNSVAVLISTQHAGARAYTDFLLGRIKKCETFEEAREAGTGLLSNCTGYRNFASWYLDKRLGEKHFIGTKIDVETQFSYKEDYTRMEKNVSYYSDLVNYLSSVIALKQFAYFEADNMARVFRELQKIEGLEETVRRYDNEMDEGDLSDVKALDDKILAIELDITTCQKDIDVLNLEKGALLNDINNLGSVQMAKHREEIQNCKAILNNYDQTIVSEDYEPRYREYIESIGLENLMLEVEKRSRRVANQIGNAKNNLLKSRSAYCATYFLNYDCANERDNKEFDQELESLQTVLLPSYRTKIENAHKKAIKEFRDDFLYKLRNSIMTVNSQIDDLNLALDGLKFGRDSYTFSVEPDNNYRDYYDMIMDDLLLSVGGGTTEYLDKYQDKIEELFSMISDSGNSRMQEKEVLLSNIHKFTDYRTYLKFDLLVRKSDDNRVTSLAQTFRTSSGGESQTPFYISILASFAQLYRVGQENNNNTTRLVIFDEAFSKMDAVRIKEACGLLKQFGLQAILSTPSEKLRDLVHVVDLILVAIHDEKKGKRSYLDVYKDTTKKTEEVKSIFTSEVREEVKIDLSAADEERERQLAEQAMKVAENISKSTENLSEPESESAQDATSDESTTE